jgi:aryl-alcohol dehydrogenase-like predicted oxidoreductase
VTGDGPDQADAALGGARTIGDLVVRRLGFGTARVLWSRSPDPRASAVQLLREVVAAGVTLLDTADCYEHGAIEEVIAEALHPYPEDLVIASKGGIELGPRWADGVSAPRNGHPAALRRACEESLRRLRTECIDLYQLHVPDPSVRFEDSVGALAELQQEGKVRHVGLSNIGRRELEVARAIVPIVSVQNRFNLDARSSERVLEECERDGVAFLPYEPGQVVETSARRAIAARHGTTVRAVAIAWLLRRWTVTCPIPGTSDRDHARANVRAADVPLTDDELDVLARDAVSDRPTAPDVAP